MVVDDIIENDDPFAESRGVVVYGNDCDDYPFELNSLVGSKDSETETRKDPLKGVGAYDASPPLPIGSSHEDATGYPG